MKDPCEYGAKKAIQDDAHCETTVMGHIVVKGHWCPGMSRESWQEKGECVLGACKIFPVWRQGRFLPFLSQSEVRLARHFRGVYELLSPLYRWENWASVRLLLKKEVFMTFFGVQIITTRMYFSIILFYSKQFYRVGPGHLEVSEAIFSRSEELLFISKLHALGNLEFSASSPQNSKSSFPALTAEGLRMEVVFSLDSRGGGSQSTGLFHERPLPSLERTCSPKGNGEERDVAGKAAIALSPPFWSSNHEPHSRRIWTI